EHVYRQLCCLCWLLEALTLERSGRFGSVASCWDAKDPGRSRNTLKVVIREKLIQAKWERFISPPKSLCPVTRLSHITSLTHKPPALSATSSSVLTTSLLGNMSSCDVTFSGEESACPSVLLQSETDPPVSK
ncbi:coiled-coil domain-containing protein 60, partial [Tachysurus ichikawai]